jgi:hypothetical protein
MAYESKNLLVAVKAFARGQALPLDKDEVWDSLGEAQTYAKSPTAYAGQTIKVLEDGEYKSYVLNGEAGAYELKPVGSVQQEDLKEYVQYVEEIPVTSPKEGVVYFKESTGEGYLYSGGEYVEVFSKDTVESVNTLNTKAITTDGGTIDGTLLLTKVPAADNEAVNKSYVDGLIGNLTSSAPGLIGGDEHPMPTEGYKAGQTWRVIEAGTYAGEICEVGDLIICTKDYVADEDASSHFMVVQANIDGAVTGPATATNLSIAVFDGATGNKIKDGGISVDSLNDVISKAHIHENKEILDSFTNTQSQILTEAANTAEEKAAAAVEGKADADSVYTKEEIDGKVSTLTTNINGKVDQIDYNDFVDSTNKSLESKANASETYLKTEVDEAIETAKSDAISTSEGYTDTKTGELETSLKSYVDTAVGTGGTSSAEAIENALAEAKKYTDDEINSALALNTF